MGTGGTPKIDTSQDSAKLRAIEKLVRYGSRGSEWKEAGLLCAIEKILNGHGTGSADMKKLMEEAARY